MKYGNFGEQAHVKGMNAQEMWGICVAHPAACKGRSYMWLKFREEESTRRKSRKLRENWARGVLIGDMDEFQFLGKLVICVQLPQRYAGRLLRKRLET
jgi:hypothetical protein